MHAVPLPHAWVSAMPAYTTYSCLAVLGITMTIAGAAGAGWTSESVDLFSTMCAASVVDASAPRALHAQASTACDCAQNGFAAHVSESDYASFSRLGAVEQANHPLAPRIVKAMLACADRGELWGGDADRKGGPLPHALLESIIAACVAHAGPGNDTQGSAAENRMLLVSKACQCTTHGVRDATSPRMLFRAEVVATPYTTFFHDMIATIEASCRNVILGARSG